MSAWAVEQWQSLQNVHGALLAKLASSGEAYLRQEYPIEEPRGHPRLSDALFNLRQEVDHARQLLLKIEQAERTYMNFYAVLTRFKDIARRFVPSSVIIE